MLSWDLEDWITDTGAAILDKRLVDPTALTPIEGLIFEIWLLDTEARNGGLSQYFCNRGVEQWKSCKSAAHSLRLTTFSPFADAVDEMVSGESDVYEVINVNGIEAENLWYGYQETVVLQLKAIAAGQQSTSV